MICATIKTAYAGFVEYVTARLESEWPNVVFDVGVHEAAVDASVNVEAAERDEVNEDKLERAIIGEIEDAYVCWVSEGRP
jgi:hypothetical protein